MNPWALIYAIGAAQAALLALALWRRPANAAANQLLAAWTALVGVDLAVRATYLISADGRWALAYAVVELFPFLHASLFYLYVRVLTGGRAFSARDLMHFAGFLLALATAGPHLVADGQWRAPPWFVLFLFGYALAYVAAALLRIARYRQRLRARRSDADRQSMHWLGAMAAWQLLIWGIAALQEIAELPFVDHYLIYGAVALWVFVTGWFSLIQPPVPSLSGDNNETGELVAATVAPAGEDSRFPEVEARLSQLMQREALYRKPALTIGQLSQRSGYPEYLVSAVINRRFGGNFWDYVNRHRIEAVRACLADPDEARTILDIAYACGFTSKSTFNGAFKRQLDQTPSDYRRRHARATPASAG